MSLIPTPMRMLTVFLTVLACMTLTNVRISAQQTCECAAPDQLLQVLICFENEIRLVHVTVCTEGFCPAVAYPHPCATQPINARTVIKSICPISWSTTNIQELVQATITGIGICCSSGAQLPGCTIGPDYLWLVSYGKCWSQDPVTNCWTSCAGSPCCSHLIKYQPNFPVPGQCMTTLLGSCDDGTTCPPGTGCVSIDCNYRVGPDCCR